MLQRLKQLPPVVRLRRARWERHFWRTDYVAHWGTFDSFAAAEAAIPPDRVVGWDAAAPAALFRDDVGINARDYPVLFWLQAVWSGRPLRVFDYGGHIGMKRYGFERYLDFDAGVYWTICDVPAVVEAGRRLADERQPVNLSFTSAFDDASGCDVLLCLGVLQFIEQPLAEQIASLPAPPRHVVVNGLPMHPTQPYVTIINNAGASFSPYKVESGLQFPASMERIGYEIVDRWINPSKGCSIPFRPDLTVRHYSGFYFRRRDDRTG